MNIEIGKNIILTIQILEIGKYGILSIQITQTQVALNILLRGIVCSQPTEGRSGLGGKTLDMFLDWSLTECGRQFKYQNNKKSLRKCFWNGKEDFFIPFYDTASVSADAMMSVRQLGESECGQIVSERIKWTLYDV